MSYTLPRKMSFKSHLLYAKASLHLGFRVKTILEKRNSNVLSNRFFSTISRLLFHSVLSSGLRSNVMFKSLASLSAFRVVTFRDFLLGLEKYLSINSV